MRARVRWGRTNDERVFRLFILEFINLAEELLHLLAQVLECVDHLLLRGRLLLLWCGRLLLLDFRHGAACVQ